MSRVSPASVPILYAPLGGPPQPREAALLCLPGAWALPTAWGPFCSLSPTGPSHPGLWEERRREPAPPRRAFLWTLVPECPRPPEATGDRVLREQKPAKDPRPPRGQRWDASSRPEPRLTEPHTLVDTKVGTGVSSPPRVESATLASTPNSVGAQLSLCFLRTLPATLGSSLPIVLRNNQTQRESAQWHTLPEGKCERSGAQCQDRVQRARCFRRGLPLPPVWGRHRSPPPRLRTSGLWKLSDGKVPLWRAVPGLQGSGRVGREGLQLAPPSHLPATEHKSPQSSFLFVPVSGALPGVSQ